MSDEPLAPLPTTKEDRRVPFKECLEIEDCISTGREDGRGSEDDEVDVEGKLDTAEQDEVGYVNKDGKVVMY